MPRTSLFCALLLLLPAAQAASPNRLPAIAEDASAASAEARQDPALHWSSLAPAQQRALRADYAAWRALDESERRHVRQAATALAALPTEQRQALRARFEAQDRVHRDGWRLGPRLGALYPKLQPLFGYLPDAQREPALALLRQLDDEQLALLVLISQRTPPQERDAVRAQLLATTAATRDAWLRAKVGH